MPGTTTKPETQQPGPSVGLGVATLHLERLTVAQLHALFEGLKVEVARRAAERQRTDA